jgi:regulator of CtrA degradation
MSATVEFFDRTMMEAMALLAETRRYLIDRSETERKGMPIESGLAASMESMRLVARLTQVLAWLLTHRAVHAGEMNLIEATRPDRRLGGRELCLNTQGEDDAGMPDELRDLLARSLSLYRRIARLDEQAAQRAVEQMRKNELTYPGKTARSGGLPIQRRWSRAYFFLIDMPWKRLLNLASWPPLSIRRCTPVQAGCDFGSMSRCKVSPGLP